MWQGLRGHDAVVEQFRRALAAGRLASAYLFVGPDGVGKRAFALQLSQALLCQRADPAELAPCGACQSCIMCDAGAHPDVHLIQRRKDKKLLILEQFIGDKEHRHKEGLCHELALKPLMGRRRIGVIDDADWFNAESANSLLKLLEEPPPGALLILIGTSRNRQLPTILSRVQVVRFHGLPTDDLRELALAQGLAPDAAQAAALAAQSGGSLASARDFADGQLWPLRDRFAAAWGAGDFDPAPLAPAFDKYIAAGGKEADARRQRFRLLLAAVGQTLRDDLRDAGASPDAALAALDRTLEAEEQLDSNANLATLLECWLDDLASVPTLSPRSVTGG
jgi:DNA polymerase-3 subunit delta'